MNLQVTDDLTVTVIPNTDHEFLMTTKEVATGYGTSKYVVQQSLHRNREELIEGKHFTTALTKCQRDLKLPHNATLWTKRGIVRLGFFIKSKQAKLFRDWAEELIIDKITKPVFVEKHQRSLPAKRRHNRLTQDRLLSIMADVAKIDDRDVRISITNKLLEGEA